MSILYDLTDDQNAVLCDLVEASRRLPKEKRQPFFLTTVAHSFYLHVIHEGMPRDYAGVYPADLDALARAGLVTVRQPDQFTWEVDLTTRAAPLYQSLKQRSAEPVQRVAAQTRSYFDADHLKLAYAAALEKWQAADDLLWRADADSAVQLTAIGHYCREAMQLFVTALVERLHITNANPDAQKTVDRLRRIIDPQRAKGEGKFLDALVAYWGELVDLVQRQEHGALKEGTPLLWEDGRRVVYQTLNVMCEVDRSVERTSQQPA